MNCKVLLYLLLWIMPGAAVQLVEARDFEDGYAVYGAGGEPCKHYIQAMKKGGKAQDYFTDWSIGYMTAFNVIMPSTYDVLGETDFSATQLWLRRRCEKYPNELFITAMLRLTEVLYPMRYQSSLKQPASGASPAGKKPASQKSVQKKK